MSTTAQRMTVDEYYAHPVEGDRRTQLIGGEVVVSEPLPIHAVLQARLLGALLPGSTGARPEESPAGRPMLR